MVSDIIKALHPYEIAVLKNITAPQSTEQLAKLTQLQEIQVSRAIQWLTNKNLVTAIISQEKIIILDENGLEYQKRGLPEMRFLRATPDSFTDVSLIAKKENISADEINIIIGTLKKKIAIEIQKEESLLKAKITLQGQKILQKPSLEEDFLAKKFPISFASLTPEEQFAFQALKSRRKIIAVQDQKKTLVTITDIGKKIQKEVSSIDINLVDQLTSDQIKSGSWKNLEYRHYDVSSPIPKIYGGKRHFVNQAIEYMKQIWIELGFQEMDGSFCQTAFWDLDSLFVPQDHPARQMQDTFFIADPKNSKKVFAGTLPKVSKTIKLVHETGGDTGSKGWGNNWSPSVASEILLRTHTTVLSAQYIHEKLQRDKNGKIIPAKFFSVNKVFRNEAVDWKHLFEFNQVEGIVVDPDANMQHLLGYLKIFFKKMGFADVRIKPSHFPYTEPSAEIEVFNPKKGMWIELGGSGIFRPEVTKSLIGEEVPVLAWGLGMERIILEYFELHDLRDLYRNDIKQLKEMKTWMKVSD